MILAGVTSADPSPATRRRNIIIGGVLALVLLYVAGALVMTRWIARDLGNQVMAVVAVDGVESVVFSGQSGELKCASPLADPEAVVAKAEAVDGVRSITLGESCTGDPVPATTTTVAPSTTLAATTTTGASTTTTVAATTTTAAPAAIVELRLDDGLMALNGTVASDAQATRLRDAAALGVTPPNVVDGLVVDPASTLGDDVVERLAALLPAMPPQLVEAAATWDGTAVAVVGTYATDQQRDAFADVAQIAGAEVTLTLRPTGTADDSAAVQQELNAIVSADPIVFEKGSTTIALSSLPTLQRVAGVAERFAGLAIEVQGYTDSEGDAGRNQVLSQQRADAVVAELVALGVPALDLTAVGYGESPVLGPDGKEIPDLSRRVVFAVTVAA